MELRELLELAREKELVVTGIDSYWDFKYSVEELLKMATEENEGE